MDCKKRRAKGFTLIELMVVVAIIAILAAIGTINYTRSRARALYTACGENVKNIGTAAMLYATDNGGRFATDIHQMTPNYLKSLPTCPSVGYTTYVNGWISASNPDAFTVVCAGSNHTIESPGAQGNYPEYNSAQGLLQ